VGRDDDVCPFPRRRRPVQRPKVISHAIWLYFRCPLSLRMVEEPLLRTLLCKGMRPPPVMIADKLARYPAAKKELMPGDEHCRHKGTRRRERQTKRFKAAGRAHQFLSAHDQIDNRLPLCRGHVLPWSIEPHGSGL
jgi:transposase-like protein